MTRLFPFASTAVLLTLASITACQTPPSEVEPAPMADAGQKKLRNALLGSWRKTDGLPQAGAEKSNADGGEGGEVVIWTFNEDGTGAKAIKPTPDADGTEDAFQWRLEGRNLVIEFDDGPDASYFRAETWSPAQMQWYRYTTDEYYTVKKYGGADQAPRQPQGRTPSR